MGDSKRSCLCNCFLWTTLILILILFLAAVAGALFWAIYRPHRPNFTISSLQISQKTTSKFNFNVIAHNPNKKITFFYDPFKISLHSDDDISLGDGSLQGFEQMTKSTNTFQNVLESSGKDSDLSALMSDLKRRRKNLGLKIVMNSKVQMKIGNSKTKKIGIKITCNGAQLGINRAGKPVIKPSKDGSCKVGIRMKIWKF